MHNRAFNKFDEGTLGQSDDRSWEVDQRPGLRLLLLYAAIAFPLLLICGRLAYLQAGIAERFQDSSNAMRETIERIPSRDGRLLAADGHVLAEDVRQFGLAMHYRWLEEPADDRWLRRQASNRLSRQERRDKERFESAKNEVLAEREEMWRQLAELIGTTDSELAARRRNVQDQVERIVESVKRRREKADDSDTVKKPNTNLNWLEQGWQAVHSAVTTSPRREVDDPVVVSEEMDYHRIWDNIPFPAASQIESQPHLYPGTTIEEETQRRYYSGNVAPHIVGGRSTLHEDQYQERKAKYPDGDPLDYQTGDRIGRVGVERAYDRILKGISGRRRIVRNRHGEIVHTEIIREPKPGRDVKITLDWELQERMEQAVEARLGIVDLKNNDQDKTEPINSKTSKKPDNKQVNDMGRGSAGGAVIAIDVRTGKVLVAASIPRFDVNDIIRPTRETWSRLNSDPRRPLFSRATQMALPPGSVFKTLTSVALLESGRFDPDEFVHCEGFLDARNPRQFRCYVYRHYGVGHGDLNLSQAIGRSCNVYFFKAAKTLGPEPIAEWSRRFGFGSPTGIDLPSEQGGNVPLPPSMNPNSKQKWYPSETLFFAIGQSRLVVTPLQIARMMAAVANDGYLVTPRIAKVASDFQQPNTNESDHGYSRQRIVGLHDGTLARVREGLELVVAHPRGTGYKTVRVKEIPFAGKTGTAEVAGRGDHAWFAGFAPAKRPQVAFTVVLEHAGSGGTATGPIVKKLIRSLAELGYIDTEQLTADARKNSSQ